MPPVSKRQRIIDDVTGQIRSGRLKPGDRLPGTTQLMATYDVSIITVRNAVAQLKTLGLVETAPGLGTFVR